MKELTAAQERLQNLADAMVEDILATPDVEILAEALAEAVRKAVAAEREACAAVCDEMAADMLRERNPADCASAIRARGET